MAQSFTLKDHSKESVVFQSRALLAFLVVFVLAAVLVARLAYLQILQFDVYATKSEDNRIKVEPIPPTRGLVYANNGTLLATNRASYSVSVIKERAHQLSLTLERLGDILELSPEDLENFDQRMKRRRRPYEPVPLRFNLTEAEIARVAVNQHRLPGVKITADLVRHYPHQFLSAHSVGYVGRINEREEAVIDNNNYAGTHHIGKIGLERFYESELHGQVGYQKVETNARGRILRVLDITPPTPGNDLELYLDLATQETAYESLGDRRGAVVAINPQTGGVIAFASTPSFNPNLFVTGIDHKTYNALNRSQDRPLFNRALQGQYPPGSTIKPFVGLAALQTGATNWEREIEDPGFYRLEGKQRKYRDWKKWGHGTVDLHKAVMRSCDTYFYDIAHRMGIQPMHDFMSPFGFGHKTGIDLNNERSGILPSPQWKQRRHNMAWFPGETLIAGIGQGFMLATPLQLATATANLANKGQRVQPQLVKAMITPNGDRVVPARDQLPPIELKETDNWEKMITAMTDVVHNIRGTAHKLSDGIDFKMAGKTGTAQVFGLEQDEEYDAETIEERLRDHALFVAFAPVDNPTIAIAVIVENGGSGGSTAGPVATQVIQTYLNQQHDSEILEAKAVSTLNNEPWAHSNHAE